MAVTMTGAIFNSLNFGGVDSADYGIYISGEGVYNAPARAIELTAVPGRNGAIPIDMGYWENIEVVYPAGSFATTQAEFAQNLADFRNAILSLRGYQKLTDTYHPNEYRMGLCVSEFEVSPALYNQAGEFELRFNCKPQRWLTSGEDTITVANGDTVTNPTLYPSNPLLAVTGNGDVSFNGFTINLDPALYGEIEIVSNKFIEPAKTLPAGGVWQEALNTSQAETNDDLNVVLSVQCNVPARSGNTYTSVTQTSAPGNGSSFIAFGDNEASITISNMTFAMSVGQAFAEQTITAAYKFVYKRSGTSFNMALAVTAKVRKGSGDTLRIECSGTWTPDSPSQPNMSQNATIIPAIVSVVEDSTKSYLGNPTYIDCDLGEAYRIDSDEVILLNRYIMLGSELPSLAPGGNSFALDNTITDLQIIPRWWQL